MIGDIWRERGDAATVLQAHALLLAPRDPVSAAQLLGAADSLRHEVGRVVPEATASVGVRTAGICRAALRSHYRTRYADGAAMHVDDLMTTIDRALTAG
jgi:hypothetical protein